MRLLEVTARVPRGAHPIVDPERLSPLTRALLVTDGTLTDTVEAFFLEPMEIARIVQRHRRLRRGLPPLELHAGGMVLDRWIEMRGAESGATRFFAHTVIAMERLTAGFRADLERTRMPLGEILRRRMPRAVREILSAGLLARAPRMGRAAGAGGPWVVRSYRLLDGRLPFALVTEYLPEHREAWTAANGARTKRS